MTLVGLMPHGTCKLCLTKTDLRDSHLLPSAVWRLLSEPGHKLRHPILMTEKVALTTSRQIHDYVLCGDCEQLLNKNGENYAISQMRGRHGFPLLDRLRVAQSLGYSGNVQVYNGADIGVDTEKLAYFAISVVWRAGTYKSRNLYSNSSTYSIDVGTFLEPMRQYLLGTGPFPANLSVNIQIATDFHSQHSAYTPSLAAGTPCPIFGFLTCGIHFAVALGTPLPQQYFQTCCHSSPDQLIFAKDLSGQSTRAFNRLFAATRVTGQLWRR
jgi:hypothetical protein